MLAALAIAPGRAHADVVNGKRRLRGGAEVVLALEEAPGEQVQIEGGDQKAVYSDAAGNAVLIDARRAGRLEELHDVLGYRQAVEFRADIVIDGVAVVRVAQPVLHPAAGQLSTYGKGPLVHEHVLPQSGVVPKLVVDVGGNQQVAVHQAAIGKSQSDGLRLIDAQVVEGGGKGGQNTRVADGVGESETCPLHRVKAESLAVPRAVLAGSPSPIPRVHTARGGIRAP